MTETSESIRKYILLKGLPREAFINKFPHPFLVELQSATAAQQDAPAFATLTATPAQLQSLQGDDSGLSTLRVHPLRKRSSGVFEGMVNVGRSMNNDIVINSNAISKLHAYFRYSVADDAYYLTDAKSTNGTFVGAKRLAPQDKERLYDGDTITFATQYRLQFFTAHGFHNHLTETY